MMVTDTFKKLYKNLYEPHPARIARNVRDYVKVGLLYHTLSAAVIPTVMAWYSITPQKTAENIAAVLGVAVPIAYLQYLSMQRYSKYNRTKKALERSGYDRRIVGGINSSSLRWFCSRYAAGIAAKETGYKKEFKETLAKHNIKWYHLVPHPREWVKSARKDPIANWVSRKIKGK